MSKSKMVAHGILCVHSLSDSFIFHRILLLPRPLFGGTWAALNEDRFLRPSNAWTTGGSKKISVDQMPSHTHQLGRNTVYTGADDYPAVSDSRYDSAWWYVWAANWDTTATGGKDYWPQYRDCYAWYRTA